MFKWFLILTFLISPLCADFKVVGYVTNRGQNDIDFSKITHLNISFFNPTNASGDFSHSFSNLSQIVSIGHQNGVKVVMSIGGGGISGTLHNRWVDLLQPSNRSDLITGIISSISSNNLDGVDVDLENSLLQEDTYSDFVYQLSLAMESENPNWILTAALVAWNGNRIADSALAQFDFINSMSYDECGPSWGVSGCNHSTFDLAIRNHTYWTVDRSLDSSKFILGVPFYGVDWATNRHITYEEIERNYPQSIDSDEANNGTIQFNGKNTIQRKTEFALQNAGGIMIWQLAQDASNESNSLLEVIDQIKKSNPVFNQYRKKGSKFQVELNQESNIIELKYPGLKKENTSIVIKVFNTKGVLADTYRLNPQSKIHIGDLNSGLYIYSFKVNEIIYWGKFNLF